MAEPTSIAARFAAGEMAYLIPSASFAGVRVLNGRLIRRGLIQFELETDVRRLTALDQRPA